MKDIFIHDRTPQNRYERLSPKKQFRLDDSIFVWPEFRDFTAQQKWAYIILLCLANISGQLSFCTDDLADCCGFGRDNISDLLHFLETLETFGLLEIHFSNEEKIILVISDWSEEYSIGGSGENEVV